ncbi:OLC1v1036659C1 [Oldenlandia corymbosa var. corymbosa]|uniref:OLC1v1036659C1 n=1 Tax=Oldenlandia corymbosa var. corymbosa TaxID=529605 RepID=A0AAV1CWL5_OLDCO|nr:OLC1v1036659C1 [Oldenlandia corymbosa var. corymbosa]
MSPAAADFSHPISSSSSSRPFSQNPNPIMPSSAGTFGPQSACLNFADKLQNGDLSFDFSNKGSDSLGHSKPTRIRHPVKKMSRKMRGQEDKDASNAVHTSLDLNLGNKSCGIANSTSDDRSSRNLGKEASGGGGVDHVQSGNLGKLGSVFGADGSGLGSNFKNNNECFASRANNTSQSSSSNGWSGSFVSATGNDYSGLPSDNGGIAFGNNRSNLMSNSASENHSYVFLGDKISSGANVSSVFDEGKGASLFGSTKRDPGLKSNLENGDFVWGASENYPSEASNMNCAKSEPIVGDCGARESTMFDRQGFVFGGRNGMLASDTMTGQESSGNNCSVQPGNINLVFASGSCKTNVDDRDFLKRDDRSGSTTSLGSEQNLGGKENHFGFSFGAAMDDSVSHLGMSRNRRVKGKLKFVSRGEKVNAARSNFQKAGLNDFVNSTAEKPNSTHSSELRNGQSKLDAQKSEFGSASVRGSSDGMKFVFGSSSNPGSAFYKVPLSKLFDDMKNLNIDNSKRNNLTDKAKVVGTNSLFGSDSKSGEKASGTVFGKENQTLNSTERISSCDVLNEKQPSHGNYLNKTSQGSGFSSFASSHVQQKGVGSDSSPAIEVENKGDFCFSSTPADACSRNVKFESSSFTPNLFPGFSVNLEFSSNNRYTRDKRLKKARGKLRQRVQAKNLNEQDQKSKEGCSPKPFESPGCYSPMDFSPCQDATNDVPSVPSTSTPAGCKGKSPLAGRPGEQVPINSKSQHENESKSSDQNGISAIRQQYRRKYKLKVGNGASGKTSVQNSDFLFHPAQSSSNSPNTFRIGQVQSGFISNSKSKAEEQYSNRHSCEDGMNGECDQWRIRGNEAYKIRDLTKAEDCYTNGINSVKGNVSVFYSKPLLLCYANRAATRMSLGRLREALEDCQFACSLDPSYLKARIRSANCHLVLGEFEEAILHYNSCLGSGNTVHLDRKIVIEASEGLQKAQKAADYLCQSSSLLQLTTSDSASCALEKIANGLLISCYSERFLQMKGEALFLLRRYDEVIELCEQTLHIAEKNFNAAQLASESDLQCKNSVKCWRWYLMSKCQFHLGRLEVALDLIERQQNCASVSEWSSSMHRDSLAPLAATIHDLLEKKKAGNEAFQSGKHSEAVELYTAAISRSLDSRPFAAVCFCNRAAAHQALGLVADAIADCSVAIALDEDYLKAISRRATLHELIRDYKQAISDLQRLVSLLENQSQKKSQQSGKLEGSSGSDAKELKQARRRLSLMEEKAKEGTLMDLYLILGLKPSDSEAEIKKAYRKAALKHHPDKAGQYLARTDGGDDGRLWKDIVEKVHEDADRLFKMIGEAYAILSDADKRSKYNLEEEIRNGFRDSKRNPDSGRSSNYYSSPYERHNWSGRETNYSSSTSERSRSRRNWQEWRSYADSHSRW